MDGGGGPVVIAWDDPRAVDMLLAIRGGNVETVRRLIAEHPGLQRARVAGRDGKGWRTPLHMVADWPGYFPNGPAIVAVLADAGADPNDRADRPRSETPLHWAASSDDYEVAVALIDAGADTEAPGGSIGTPLANAIGYACWHVARLLVARGAHVDALWIAAALGDWTSLEAILGGDPAPGAGDISHAFWQACHGGQLRMAQYLLAHGADKDFRPEYAQDSAARIAVATDTRRQALEAWLRDIGAT